MTPEEFDLEVARKLHRMSVSAKDRGVEFNLGFTSLRNIMKSKRCFYTGMPIYLEGSPDADNHLTVDRKDPTKGYVKGNVVACSHFANKLKNTWEALHPKRVYTNQEDRKVAIAKVMLKDVKTLQKMAKAVMGEIGA